ncbi:retrovirus-related pol polyprotein from transposon TNT 1-94 [Tanacetum coccineum]
MCNYLKNMEGYKLKDLKLKEFDSIQEMFDRAFKRVNTFEDFRTELVEGKKKRAGTKLIQENGKKQKVEDDKETTELKQLMKIIPDEEEVAIDVIPWAVKSPSIVGWKIYKEGRKIYYQIMRADRKSQMYMFFSQMLKSFDREDLTKKYEEVLATEKIQADCDLKATNIVLQGLPPDVKFVMDVKLARDLHTTNYDQLYSYLDQHETYANETRLMRERYQDPLAFVANYNQPPSHLTNYHSQYNTTQFPQQTNTMIPVVHSPQSYSPMPLFKMAGLLCNKFKGGKDKVMMVHAIRVMLLVPRETMQEGKKGLLNAVIVKVKDTWLGNALSLRGQGTLYGLRTRHCWLKHMNLTEDLDAYDSNCDGVSNAKAVLMTNLSNYGSDVISDVPHFESYHNDLDNQTMHAMQDFEQTPAAVQDTNLYAQQDSMILSMIKQMSEQMINHVNNWEKTNQEKNNESLIAELERYKERPTLYVGSVISTQHAVIPVIDEEETLILEVVSRSKMLAKEYDPISKEKKINTTPINYVELNKLSEDFGKRFVPQQEFSVEQAFWLQTSNPDTKQYDISPVRIEAPSELPKDILLTVMNSTTVYGDSVNVEIQNSESCDKCFDLDAELLKKQMRMFKLDIEPISHRLKNNRDAHEDNLKKTIENIDTIRGLICPSLTKPSEKLVAVTLINKVMKVSFSEPLTSSSNIHKQVESSKTPDSNTLVLPSKGLKSSTSATRSQPTRNKKNDRISQTPSSNMKNKVEAQLRRVNLSPNKKNRVKDPICDANIKVYSKRHKQVKAVGLSKKAKIVESRIANNSEPNHSWGSNATDVPSSSSLVNDRLSRLFSGTVRFRNDHIAKIMGYGDYQLGNVTISRLAKDGLVRGIPKLKFKKDHLCLACALGKIKKSSHQPRAKDTNQEKLYLLHMDLYGLIRVESINGKKYILVIVDDYSQFTWVKILRSKDEAPDAIIKCIKNIKVHLNATVSNVRIDNGTEFVNQTLREFYENVGISHGTSITRTPQRNDVVKRRNQALVEAARIISLCYLTNYDLGKLNAKADVGIFVGYAPAKKAFRIYNRRTRKIMETIHVTFDEMTEMACEQFSLGPGLHLMTTGTSSSVLVPNPVPQQPSASPSSTTIDRDAPSTSTSSTNQQEKSTVISQGVEEPIPNAPFDDPCHEPLHEISTSQELSSNSQSSHSPLELIGKWTKDHPLENVIGNPSRLVSTRKHLETDAMWCYFNVFLTSVELKNFKEPMLESSWIDAMQEEIHEFERLEVWKLVLCPDKVLLIKLKLIHKVKTDEFGAVLKNKA